MRRAEWLALRPSPAAGAADVRGEDARAALERAGPPDGGWLAPEDAARMLEAYGIAVPRVQAAGSAAQAAELART